MTVLTSVDTRSTNLTLTPQELATRWHCSPGWLANRRCKGLAPAYLKLGSKVIYRLDDVEAAEAAGRVEPVGAH